MSRPPKFVEDLYDGDPYERTTAYNFLQAVLEEVGYGTQYDPTDPKHLALAQWVLGDKID